MISGRHSSQIIIDKVVVHRTESTQIVIGIGLAIFMVFSGLLTWVRQYLVLHTGTVRASVSEQVIRQHPGLSILLARPTAVSGGVDQVR